MGTTIPICALSLLTGPGCNSNGGGMGYQEMRSNCLSTGENTCVMNNVVHTLFIRDYLESSDAMVPGGYREFGYS